MSTPVVAEIILTRTGGVWHAVDRVRGYRGEGQTVTDAVMAVAEAVELDHLGAVPEVEA